MAKKSKQELEELEEYMEAHNVEVTPPKTEFRDKRMNTIECPLCEINGAENLMKLIRLEEHSFGEFGLYQCEFCGTVLDLCNMVNKPAEFDLVSKMVHGKYFQSVRTILKSAGEFSHMPKECSIHAIAAEKEKKAAEKDERMDYCKDCHKKFTPQKSCIAVRDYCATCRKEIPKEDERWKKDVKPAKKVVTKEPVVKKKTKTVVKAKEENV
jgi:hypothetical protein